MSHRQHVARLAAPAAFLLAVTIFVLLVRSATSDDSPSTSGATSTATSSKPPPPTTTKAPTTTAAKPAGATYTIQSGDTLESIASEYGTSVEELVTLNPAIDPTNLQVGQTIRVP